MKLEERKRRYEEAAKLDQRLKSSIYHNLRHFSFPKYDSGFENYPVSGQ
jgi:hypothetical protein